MVMPYDKSPFDEAIEKVFMRGAESIGFDGIPDTPQMRGLVEVAEYVADFTLAALIEGLGIKADSDEYRRIRNAYVSGKMNLDPETFPSVFRPGKTRTLGDSA